LQIDEIYTLLGGKSSRLFETQFWLNPTYLFFLTFLADVAIFSRNLSRGGEIGRRTGLKIQRTQVHAGSIPALGTQ
jgi:hypothetical protein